MPELPEVETVRQGLMRTVVGKTIQAVHVTWDRIIQDDNGVAGFEQKMRQQTLEKVERRGKYLLFYWSEDGWISHLRMEGKWLVVKRDVPVNRHTHVVIQLDSGEDLRYQDVRKFGRIHRVAKQAMPEAIAQLKLGVEPRALTNDYLIEKLHKTTRTIKAVLLDQHVIAGIGNIYCDEALWRAKIHPGRIANTLTPLEIMRLVIAIKTVIQAGIAAGGTTIRTYKNTFGEAGGFQHQLAVYKRAGKPCWRCDTLIEKQRVTQRGTHFCPACQTLVADNTLVVGLTGSIATGKSTVSAYLKHSGVPLIDLDEIVHTLQQPNTETMAALVQAFGTEILTDQATLNRHHLGSLIFNDDQTREKLNKTMRPFIVKALREQLSAYQMNHAPLVVLDIPLLFELGYEWWCDQTLVVSVPEPIQIQRLMTRDHLTQTEAEQRIASQWPQKDKIARATHCIDNSESLMNTYQQVDEWLLHLPTNHSEAKR